MEFFFVPHLLAPYQIHRYADNFSHLLSLKACPPFICFIVTLNKSMPVTTISYNHPAAMARKGAGQRNPAQPPSTKEMKL